MRIVAVVISTSGNSSIGSCFLVFLPRLGFSLLASLIIWIVSSSMTFSSIFLCSSTGSINGTISVVSVIGTEGSVGFTLNLGFITNFTPVFIGTGGSIIMSSMIGGDSNVFFVALLFFNRFIISFLSKRLVFRLSKISIIGELSTGFTLFSVGSLGSSLGSSFSLIGCSFGFTNATRTSSNFFAIGFFSNTTKG